MANKRLELELDERDNAAIEQAIAYRQSSPKFRPYGAKKTALPDYDSKLAGGLIAEICGAR